MAMLNNQMVLENWNWTPPWSSWSSNPPWSEDGKIPMVSGEDFPWNQAIDTSHEWADMATPIYPLTDWLIIIIPIFEQPFWGYTPF